MILHRFNADKNEIESGIGYDMIIGRALMLHQGLTANIKHKVLQCDGAAVPMKYPRGLLEQTYLTSGEICEVVIQTAEPVSAMETI